MLRTPVPIHSLKLSNIGPRLEWETAWELLMMVAWVQKLMLFRDEQTLSSVDPPTPHPRLVMVVAVSCRYPYLVERLQVAQPRKKTPMETKMALRHFSD